MPPIDFSHVNITIQQFDQISDGKYNAGEVRLMDANTLTKINNHVHKTSKNRVSLSHLEVLAIKDAFVKALRDNGVSDDEITRVRQELGLAAKAPMDRNLTARSIKPLSRQQIREILDRNAATINQSNANNPDFVQVRTSRQIYGANGMSTGRLQTQQEVNRETQTQRHTETYQAILIAQAVIGGQVDFHGPDPRNALLQEAKSQKEVILRRSHGNPSNEGNASLHIRVPSSGLNMELPLGMSEAAYVDRLDGMIMRLSVMDPVPQKEDLDARHEFIKLKDVRSRNRWADAQVNAIDGGHKLRTAAVYMLSEANITDYEILSKVNRLSLQDVLDLVKLLIQLAGTRPRAELRDALLASPNYIALSQRDNQQVPTRQKAFIPAFSKAQFNSYIIDSFTQPSKMPHRFMAMMEEVKQEMQNHFGTEAFRNNPWFKNLPVSWNSVVEGPNGEQATPESIRERVKNAVKTELAKNLIDNQVKTMLANEGGNQAHSTGIVSNYCVRHPEILTRLKTASNPEECRAIINEKMAELRNAVHLHIISMEQKQLVKQQALTLLAQKLGIAPERLDPRDVNLTRLSRKAEQLASGFVSGEKVAGNDDEIRAAFRTLVETHVNKVASLLQKLETMELTREAKDAIEEQILRTSNPNNIDLDAIAMYSVGVNLRAIADLINANASKQEVYELMDATISYTQEMTNAIFSGKGGGNDPIGAPEYGCTRNILFAMAGSRQPGFAATLQTFLNRPEVQADRPDGVDTPAASLRLIKPIFIPEDDEVRVTLSQQKAFQNELETRFAPNGSATQLATSKGYHPTELAMLKKVATFCQIATGCSVDEAVNAALDPTSTARRLTSYGGRFTENIENFKKGLQLITEFKTWYPATIQALEHFDPTAANPNASPTIINSNKAVVTSSTERAMERFVFEELAVNHSIPLKTGQPEQVFSMEKNPAFNFLGRLFGKAMYATLGVIPPEMRSKLFALTSIIAPLGARRAESVANSLQDMGAYIIGRFVKHYDQIVAMMNAGTLTRESFYNTFFPDVPNAANMTNAEISDAIRNKIMVDIVPHQFNNDFSKVPQIFFMMQYTGATIDECATAITQNQQIPELPYIAKYSPAFGEMDGTANGGRKQLLGDLLRPEIPTIIETKQRAIEDNANCVFRVNFPDGTTLASKTGKDDNPEVIAANGAIADKVEEFVGKVHQKQLSSIYFLMSQSGAGNVNKGLTQYGYATSEHTPLTYTLTRNEETGAITIRTSEPTGFPIRFHWETTVQLDGSSTATPMVVEA